MTTTLLDNSANEFAAFSTILSGFDEEYVSPNRKSKSSFSLSSSPTAKKNVAESFSSPSPQAGRGRGRGKGYNNYDPDEPLDVLQEMNQMLEAAERSPTNTNENYTKKARTFVREAYGTFEDSASRLERDLMEKENRMKRDAAEELRRQLDKDSPEFSLDMLASGDRATILAREAEILRAEEESLRRVREGASRAAERERQRLESERVAHANGRANWVSAENKRRGMGANARASEQSNPTPARQAQRGGGVGTVTPTRIVPKFTTNGGDMEEDKENAGAMGSKRDKTTRPSSFFNPFKTITNVAVGAKNALLSRENPKQKPKVRRSIIAIDEPNENSMNATGPSAVVSSYKTPVQESKKRSTILTPVESRETNRGISSSYEEEDEGEEDATESDVMIAKMISPGQMVYIKKPIEKATDIAATNEQENRKDGEEEEEQEIAERSPGASASRESRLHDWRVFCHRFSGWFLRHWRERCS